MPLIKQMYYNWINLYEIPEIKNNHIVLFGAGAGSEELLELLKSGTSNTRISCVVDNDVSLHEKLFCGYNIIHPDRLNHISFDKIIVTTVSGRDAIAKQLDSMGFLKNRDYFLVGRYPVSFSPAFDLVKEYFLSDNTSLEGSVCLNIGPGGSFALEALLYSYGAHTVFTIDKHRFGSKYPDVSRALGDYQLARASLVSIEDVLFRKYAINRFDSLFTVNKDQYFLDETKIRFIFPMDVCELLFADSKFDFVFSSGVLEHVEFPESAVSEIMRVLKPDGVTLHRVITRDHRSFSKSSGCHAFSFRNYTGEEWDEISLKKFYQNRVLPVEWKKLFISNGMSLDKYRIEEKMELHDTIYKKFHSDFHDFSQSELEEINCVITGKRM